MFISCGIGLISLLFLFTLIENVYAESDPALYYDCVQALWPFALNVTVVAVFFRVSGIIYERTVSVGEILILHGSEPD